MRRSLANLVSKIEGLKIEEPENGEHKFNPLTLVTNQQTEMEFKRAVFEWVEKSEEVIKELQDKKIQLRKKEIKQRGLV